MVEHGLEDAIAKISERPAEDEKQLVAVNPRSQERTRCPAVEDIARRQIAAVQSRGDERPG